jgi:hypothetical protein
MNREEFIGASIELNLFWTRILKEHCIFLEAGLPCKDIRYIQGLDRLKVQFELLLYETLEYAGALPAHAHKNGAFITEYTESAENKTMDLTGVSVNVRLTDLERKMLTDPRPLPVGRLPEVFSAVRRLNDKASSAALRLLEMQSALLDEILKGTLFSANYPAVYTHMNEETEEYVRNLRRLSANEAVNAVPRAFEEFWNRNMEEHAATVRGLLDPSERAMFGKADAFAKEYGELNAELKAACGGEGGGDGGIAPLGARAAELTRGAKRYNCETVHALLTNGIKGVIPPLLADHMLRETNYYMAILS